MAPPTCIVARVLGVGIAAHFLFNTAVTRARALWDVAPRVSHAGTLDRSKGAVSRPLLVEQVVGGDQRGGGVGTTGHRVGLVVESFECGGRGTGRIVQVLLHGVLLRTPCIPNISHIWLQAFN